MLVTYTAFMYTKQFSRSQLRVMGDRILPRGERVGGCLVWPGAKTRQGYGHVKSGVGKQTAYVHRVVWSLTWGDIPPGHVIDHLCENPSCIEIQHLRSVPVRTNVLRGTGPTAENARKTRCKAGHQLEGANLRIGPTGNRVCRECAKLAQRRSRAKRTI